VTELAQSLKDPESGEIISSPKDYEERQGITGIPITSEDVTKIVPICHSKIHVVSWILVKLIPKVNSTMKWSSSSRQIRYSDKEI
jgi:hypothetical protein